MASRLTRKIRTLLLLLLMELIPLPRTLAAQSTSLVLSESTAQQQTTQRYSLPPDKLQRALEYARARYWLHFTGEIYGMAVLLAILMTGLSAKFRNWASATSSRRFPQA